MDYIVFDLEWNQADDEKTKLENSLVFEIIEIGAVKLNGRKQKISDFHELIRPQVFLRMNKVTGELIHLSMDQLRDCRTFPDVAADFIKWCGKDFVFCTWGNLDLLELQKNMDYYNMTSVSEKPIKFYDVQKLFSIAFEDGKLRRSLQYAVDFLGIKKDVGFHRAYADAYYTAQVIGRITEESVFCCYSFDTYHLPRNKDEEININFGNYSKYISMEFPDKVAAMADREVVSARCFLCGAKTRKKVPWFTNNGKHYYTIVTCSRHGALKGKIRLRKSGHNKIYVVKTMKQVGADEVRSIMEKRNLLRESRREKRHHAASDNAH